MQHWLPRVLVEPLPAGAAEHVPALAVPASLPPGGAGGALRGCHAPGAQRCARAVSAAGGTLLGAQKLTLLEQALVPLPGSAAWLFQHAEQLLLHHHGVVPAHAAQAEHARRQVRVELWQVRLPALCAEEHRKQSLRLSLQNAALALARKS